MNISVSEGIALAVATLLVLLVVAFGYNQYTKTIPLQTYSSSSMDTITTGLISSGYNSYDNKDVQGDQVISAINTKASPTVTVIVKTLADTTGKRYNTASYNISDENDPDYINVQGSFHSTLGKNTNGKVDTITFVQQN